MKTSIKTICILLITVAFFSACTRDVEIPQTSVQEPELGATFIIGNATVNLFAGENNYYQYSGYNADTSGVLVLWAQWRVKDCSSCKEVLKISVSDYTIRQQISDILNTLKPATYEYLGPQSFVLSDSIPVQFTSDSGMVLNWQFGDGKSAQGAVITHNYATSGQFNVCAGSACSSTICNNIFVGTDSSCNVQFEASGLSTSSYYTFTATSGHTQYTWTTSDTAITIPQTTPTASAAFPQGGVYKIYVATNDGGVCSSTFCKEIVANRSDTCHTSYSYKHLPKQLVTSPQYSKVQIDWIDKQGNSYTSRKNAGQPQSSTFVITGVQPYNNNEKGQKTCKVTASLQAMLYNINNPNDSLSISTTKVVFAVAYPQ